MNKLLKNFILILFLSAFFQPVSAENIHFNDKIYDLKYNEISTVNKISENEYFLNGESRENWTSMVGIYYYPEISNPIKFSNDVDKKIEDDNRCVLLKFMQNKKQDIAIISYLENMEKEGKHFFVYNIYKYEKHPDKGMMVLRFAKKYDFITNEDIKKIGYEIRNINNDYMEKLIIAPIPPIVEKIDKITH